ncbi:MAG: MoaD/ThiS family protein [Bacillota bacterium]
MVTVSVFGLLRSNHNIKQFSIDACGMRDVVEYLKKTYPHITNKELEEAILFVNQEKIMHMKRFDIPLTDGDNIVFTTYVGGG